MRPVYTQQRHYHVVSVAARVVSTPADRDLAHLAIDELKRTGHLERTHGGGTDYEGWVRMAPKGYAALETRRLDALDEALHALSPALAEKRQEMWSAFADGRRAEAASAGFELFRSLEIAAPDEAVRATPDFKPDPSATSHGGVTRAHRARYIVQQRGDMDAYRIEAAAQQVVAAARTLGEMKHRVGEGIPPEEARDALALAEMALWRVFVGYK